MVSSGGDHARPRARLDRHVADGHAAIHRQGADGAAAVLEHVALPAARADLRDDREDDVLGRDAGSKHALDRDGHGLERLQRKGLGREHVLDLARADAERHGAERAVGARVAVAADDRDARHGQPELGTDDVHDALLDVAERVQADAELLRVPAQGVDLGAARQVGDGLVDGERRGVVVLGRDGQVRSAHRAAGHPQPVEGLRAGDLVHEVKVDVDEVGRAVLALHDEVVIPDLLGEGLARGLRSGRV